MSRHLPLETLSALLDSELAAAEAEAAQAHVVECAECRGRLEGLRVTVDKLHGLPPASPPPHVREALRRQLAVEHEIRRRLWTLPGWHSRLAAWPAMAAAVFLAFGCGLFLYAYLVRQSVPQPAAEQTPPPEGEWRATITYERPPDEPADLAAGVEGSTSGRGTAPAQGKLEGQRRPSRIAAAAPPPPAAPPDRPVGLAKTAPAERLQPEVGGARQDAAQVGEAPVRDRAEAAAASPPTATPSPASDPAAPAPAAPPTSRALADEQVAPLGPGIEPPVKLSGENPDFQSLRGMRFRKSLVIVEGTIGLDGILRDLTFQPRDLDPQLTDLLRRTLSTWRFEPARKDGRSVAVQYRVTVNIHPQ